MQVYEFMALSTDATTGTLIPSLLYIDVFEITVLPETISRQRFEPPLLQITTQSSSLYLLRGHYLCVHL